MAQRIIDPLFSSGLRYAQSIAGGENIADMIAPGVGYSEEFPEGFVMRDGVPVSVREEAPMPAPPPPPPPALMQEPVRTAPFNPNNPYNLPIDPESLFINTFPTGYSREGKEMLDTGIPMDDMMDVIQPREAPTPVMQPPMPPIDMGMVDASGLSREEIESGAFDALMFPSIPEPQPIKYPSVGYTPFDFTNIQAALDSVVPVRGGGTGTRGGGRIRR